MSQISLAQPDEKIASRIWPQVFICICLLMAVTISPPDDMKAAQFATASILPPAVIKLFKLVGRSAAILVITYSLYLVWNNPRRRKTTRVLLPIIAFVIFALCSIAWSASKPTSLIQAASFATLIALAHLIGTIWIGEADTSRLLKCCSVVLLLISTILVFLHFVRPDVGALTRDSAGLFHSTSAGAASSLGLVIVFASYVIWGWSWSRWLIVPATVAHLTSSLIGGNRLSLAVTILVCLILFLIMTHKAIVASSSLVLVVALVVYACVDPGLMLFDAIVEKLSGFTAQGQTSTQLNSLSGRVEMWQKIWDSFLDSPFIGHGYFMTSKTGRIFVWYEWGNWTAHNIYLQLLATVGIFGTALFLLGIANVVVRVILRVGTPDRSAHRLAVFLLAVFTWYLGWSLLNESVLGPLQPESVVFAIALGLGVAMSTQTLSSNCTDETPAVASRGATS